MKRATKPEGVERRHKLTRMEQITIPGPAAALRRTLDAVKRQPISLARALGERSYVRAGSRSLRTEPYRT